MPVPASASAGTASLPSQAVNTLSGGPVPKTRVAIQVSAAGLTQVKGGRDLYLVDVDAGRAGYGDIHRVSREAIPLNSVDSFLAEASKPTRSETPAVSARIGLPLVQTPQAETV